MTRISFVDIGSCVLSPLLVGLGRIRLGAGGKPSSDCDMTQYDSMFWTLYTDPIYGSIIWVHYTIGRQVLDGSPAP